jgi:hypothetical protein
VGFDEVLVVKDRKNPDFTADGLLGVRPGLPAFAGTGYAAVSFANTFQGELAAGLFFGNQPHC